MSGIKRVSYYAASPVRTCDRCAAGIKHVFVVTFQDGMKQKYGSECINKVLANVPTLKSLYNSNVKKLQKRLRALEALSLPYEQMPRGREYFGSGLYFIADSQGKDVMAGDMGRTDESHWFFHPLYDTERNAAGRHYVVTDQAKHVRDAEKAIAAGKAWLSQDIERIETFLARVLAKGGMQPWQPTH